MKPLHFDGHIALTFNTTSFNIYTLLPAMCHFYRNLHLNRSESSASCLKSCFVFNLGIDERLTERDQVNKVMLNQFKVIIVNGSHSNDRLVNR